MFFIFMLRKVLKIVLLIDLFQVLKMMTGKNLTNSQLQQIVDRTFVYLGKDENELISFEEFCQLVQNNATLRNVTGNMAVEI